MALYVHDIETQSVCYAVGVRELLLDVIVMIISLILGKGHSQSGPIFFLLGFPSVQRELFPIYVESAVPIDNYGTLC